MSLARVAFRAALAAAIIVSALSAEERGLTLEQALEIALARNPDVLAARAEIDAARGRTLQLRSRPEPALTAGVEGLPLPGLRQEGDEVEVRLGVEQVLEYPGKRSLRDELGRLGEELASAALARIEIGTSARVKRAYWRAVRARSETEALERSSVRLEAFLADLEAKYRSGSGAYADVLRARAERARLRNQMLEAGQERLAAASDLNLILGREPSEPVELMTGLTFTPLAADLDGFLARALMTRPSARIAGLDRDRAVAAVKLAGLDRRPDLLAGFSLPSKRLNGWGVSLGLTMPFLRPGRLKGQALEAEAEAERARIALAATERRLRAAVATAYAAAKAAGEQVLVFERDLLGELEDELDIQLEYFRYGKIEAYNLIDLHRTFLQAEIEHLRALFLYNVALADLEVAGEEAY
jgi:cobalt-zinc-cadmium efflux system outer membrane protein